MEITHQSIKIHFTHFSFFYPQIFLQISRNTTFLVKTFKNFHITVKNYTYTTSIAKIRRERDGNGTICFVKSLFIIHSLNYLFLLYNYNTVFLFLNYTIYSSGISSSSILRVLKLLQNHYLRNVGHFYHISVVWKKDC